MRFLTNWHWESAILFCVLIAVTDPVSVIASFKEAGVHGRLRLLVEAESLLFHASTAAVAFVVAHWWQAESCCWRGGRPIIW